MLQMTIDSTSSDGGGADATLHALKAIRDEMAAIRESIGRWDKIIKRLKEDNIAELLTRDELVDHSLYAFCNLVLARVNHIKEGPEKEPWTGRDSEFLIYGSGLTFAANTIEHPDTREDVDGIRLGLEKGVNFRLSMLSPIPDTRDDSASHHLRERVPDTLDFFLKVKRDAQAHDWSGGFLLTATPQLLSDSFSSIKIGCDRRVSVLAAARHRRVTEYVFDESPVHSNSAASELRRDYYKTYEQDTFPLLMYGWEELPQELLSVRVIVFANRDWIITDHENHDEPWISWEFPWEDASRLEQICTYKLVHSINAPSFLGDMPLTDIVFAGNIEGKSGRRHILFLARQARRNAESREGLIKASGILRFFTGHSLARIKIYRSAIS